MPELQQTEPTADGMPPMAFNFASSDDSDYALGCECADPALQIERWTQEARAELG
jgi:hypothetical protein